MHEETAPVGTDLGTAVIKPCEPVIAGSMGEWKIRYIVGAAGIDEGGTIKIAQRFASDWQKPQFENPEEAGYTTVQTNGAAKLKVRFNPKGLYRPWMKCVEIDVYDGSLAPGDFVEIVYGNRSGGSPGIRAQSFQESHHEFRIFVDPTNACSPKPLPQNPGFPVINGEAEKLIVILPSQTVCGEAANIHLRGEDKWGNPAPAWPETELVWEGDMAAEIDKSTFTLTANEGGNGRVIAKYHGQEYSSNPITIFAEEPQLKRYWGDLHAQSDATVGTGTEEEYFRFARDVAALDFTSHQGNDFQMTDEDWQRLNNTVRQFHCDGEFVVFPGYEWSGNTTAGGDRNVFYREEGMPILRSSHWQTADIPASNLSPAHPVTELFSKLHQHVDAQKVLLGAHVGGRYADISLGFDEKLGPLVEVVSCWGIFEWLIFDAFEKYFHIGIMANSDGHKGRPGAEGPGAGEFGISGGLTCVLAESQTRDAIFTALKNRRCYATTGTRIDLDFSVNGASMGEIIQSETGEIVVRAKAKGSAPVEKIQLFRGKELLQEQYAPEFSEIKNSHRLRLAWKGSRMRGRGRRVTWDGEIRFENCRLQKAQPWSFDSPSDGILEQNDQLIRFTSHTTGDSDGLDLWLEDASRGTIIFDSAAGKWEIDLSQLSKIQRRDFGGLDMEAWIERYPKTPESYELSLKSTFPAPEKEYNPYWMKTIQCDGQMAWGSPIYVKPKLT
jgi:hypothetical protein